MTTIHINIKGTVQGVFYRDSAKKQARKLGITGWIRNLDDGNVEVMASGDNTALDQFIQWCKLGSEQSKVEDVSFDTVDDKNFTGFTIRH